jgi:hypothetical protein
MLDVGGQDSTEAFEDVGHSDEAREILDGLLVTPTPSPISKSLELAHNIHRPTLRRAILRSLPTKHLTRNLAPLHPCQTPPYPTPWTPGPRNHSGPYHTHTSIHTQTLTPTLSLQFILEDRKKAS